MKKVLLLTLSCLLVSGAWAQNSLGLKAGGGIALRMGDAGFNNLPGMNIIGGLAYKHQIFNRVVLEGDVLFDMRANQVELSDASTAVYGANYISVPITIHWNTPFKRKNLVPYRTGQPKSFWYIEGGPHVNYGLSVEAYDPNATPTPKKIDVGVTGGLGLSFGFEETLNRFNVGARANYGFLNIYDEYSGAPTLTNLTAGGYVQYDFALNKRRHVKFRW